MPIHALARQIGDLFRQRLSVRSRTVKGSPQRSTRLEVMALEDRTVLTATGSATMFGMAFIDTNGNGVRETREVRIPGLKVTLTGEINGVTKQINAVTNANGVYRFLNVPQGDYTLKTTSKAFVASNSYNPNVTIDGGQTERHDIFFQGLKSGFVSSQQFLNNIRRASIPIVGNGRAPAKVVYRENNRPIVATTATNRTLFGVSSTAAAADFLTIRAKNEGSTTVMDLSGFFDDADAANTRVQFVVQVGTATRLINVELMDRQAPQTVQNFLNYVKNNKYDDTVFHRLVSGFVVQGGGYKVAGNATVSTTDINNTTLTDLPADPAVQNEFSATRSNVQGTIAMAKLGDDPNSATNEFFFNLANTNAANLDNQNQGFTVFGKLVGTADQTAVNALAALSPTNVTGFQGFPLNQGSTAPNTADFPKNIKSGLGAAPDNFSEMAVIKDIKITRQDEVLTYSVKSVTSLTGGAQTLVTNASIVNNNRLSLQTAAGDVSGDVKVTITVTDRFGASVDASFTVKVGKPPEVTVAIDNQTPGTNDTLTATSTVVSSPGGAPVTFTYVWKVDGEVKQVVTTTSTTNTFNLATAGNGDTTDVVTVEVLPSVRNVTGQRATDSTDPIS